MTAHTKLSSPVFCCFVFSSSGISQNLWNVPTFFFVHLDHMPSISFLWQVVCKENGQWRDGHVGMCSSYTGVPGYENQVAVKWALLRVTNIASWKPGSSPSQKTLTIPIIFTLSRLLQENQTTNVSCWNFSPQKKKNTMLKKLLSRYNLYSESTLTPTDSGPLKSFKGNLCCSFISIHLFLFIIHDHILGLIMIL